MTKITQNVKEIRKFLMLIRPKGIVLIVVIRPGGGPPVAQAFNIPSKLSDAVAWIMRMNADGVNIYFEPNPAKHASARKSKEQDIATVVFLVVDIDPEKGTEYLVARQKLLQQVLKKLLKGPLKPTIVIDSGNGIQVLYKLNDPSTDLLRCKNLNMRLARELGGDSTYSVDHLFRIPGTLNYPSATKIQRGYPAEPTLARIMHLDGPVYSIDNLDATLPELRNSSISSANEDTFDEDESELTDDEKYALNQRFQRDLDNDPTLRRRWEGSTEGLNDTTRSGFDISMTALLKARDYKYREVRHLLISWEHGRGAEKVEAGDERYFRRMWTRTGGPSVGGIIERVDKLHQDGELDTATWCDLLYRAHLRPVEVESVLKRLVQLEVGGMQALKQTWRQYHQKQTEVDQERNLSTGIKQELLELYIYVKELDKFFDTVTGALLKPEVVGRTHAHQLRTPQAHTWLLARPEMRKVDTVCFWPGVDSLIVDYHKKQAVNLWCPPELEIPTGVTDDDIRLFLDLIEYLIPNDIERKHVLDWMAYALQHQDKKINHALLIAGNPRIGKDTIIQPLIYGLGGEIYVSQPGVEELKEKYTDYLHCKKLVVFQEVMNFEKLSVENKLKPILASPPEELRIRLFGEGFYTTPNTVLGVFFSNHRNALQISEGDGRYYAVWCGAEPRKPRYYEQLYRWYEDRGKALVVGWLKQRDVSRFKAKAPAPMTDYKKAIIDFGRNPLEEYLEECLENRQVPLEWDLVKYEDIVDAVNGPVGFTWKRSKKISDRAIKETLSKLGVEKLQDRYYDRKKKDRVQVTYWAVRNVEKFKSMKPKKWHDYYENQVSERRKKLGIQG